MKIALVFFLFLAFAKDDSLPKTDIQFKSGKKVSVEVAQSFSERSKGLMNRTELAEDSGMLFVFGHPQVLSFWMKNTYVPLSIAYIDKNKVIKEIYNMKPQSLMEKTQHTEDYPSQCRCQYALEMNKGWFEKNKIKVGETLQFQLPQP